MRWARTADQHIRTMAQYRKQTRSESEQWEYIHLSGRVLGEGRLKAGRMQKSHQKGQAGPPLHSWKCPILIKTRASSPFLATWASFAVNVVWRERLKQKIVMSQSRLLHWHFKVSLTCVICPQLKDLFPLVNQSTSPVNQSNPAPWIPLPTLRLAGAQALAREWWGWAAVPADPGTAHLCQPQPGGFTFSPALWLLILLWSSLAVPTSTPPRCFLQQISGNACSCLEYLQIPFQNWI